MSHSSGVNVSEFKAWRTCPVWQFTDQVDAWFDRETRSGGWQCSMCNADHESSF